MLLNPYYISGLVQADGSFFVTISKNPKSKYGLRIRATFTITQNSDSIGVLEQVQSYFKCGNVFINQKRGSAEFVVNSIPDLQRWIIPHFISYPLHCSKQRSFLIFLSIVDILDKKTHYNKEVFASLIKMAFTMNEVTNRGSERLEELLGFLGSEAFQIEIKEPEIKDYPLDSHFLVGLIEGDGCFNISFLANRVLDFGFHITQHISSLPLLEKVQQLLGCGSLRYKSDTVIRYQIDSLNEIQQILLPFMSKHQLHSVKSEHFSIFEQVINLVTLKEHKTNKGFLRIVDLAYNMNLEGKRRKLTKEEYLKSVNLDPCL